MKYEIFCDGATSGNGKANAPGGWAYVILSDGKEIARGSGAEVGTTNQRMELIAALRACEELEKIDPFAEVIIYSDSAYFINCFKQNWWRTWEVNGWRNSKKERVANDDLWQKIIPFFRKAPSYDFVKIKGHAGNFYNELVDKMAVMAKRSVM